MNKRNSSARTAAEKRTEVESIPSASLEQNGMLGEVVLSENELDNIGHSLGVNIYHAKRSKKRKDKKLPKDFYRNYFNSGIGHSDYKCLISLCEKGLMEKSSETYFHVTEQGIEIFKSEFARYVSVNLA